MVSREILKQKILRGGRLLAHRLRETRQALWPDIVPGYEEDLKRYNDALSNGQFNLANSTVEIMYQKSVSFKESLKK